MKQEYHGINIQFPISQLIVSGKKTIETRTYPIPSDYIGKELVLIETPGKSGKFKARMIALIRFDKSFRYLTKKQFYSDSAHHCVTPGSPWAWKDAKSEKWGWPVKVLTVFSAPLPLQKRSGIKFSRGIVLDI